MLDDRDTDNWQLAAIMASQCVLCVALAVSLQACHCIFAAPTATAPTATAAATVARGQLWQLAAMAALAQKHFTRQKH